MTENGDAGVLPLVARDVRVVGSDPEAESGPGPWAGVRSPFGGVLNPGVAVDDWPPAGLSHLALADLLASALGPTAPPPEPERTSPARDRQADTDSTDEAAEPTVREVVRQATEPPDESPSAATHGRSGAADRREDVPMSLREPPTTEGSESPSDESTPPAQGRPADDATVGRRDVSDGSADAATGGPTDGDEPTPGTTAEIDSSARPVGVDAPPAPAPRTVVRNPAMPPAPPTTVTERRIARLVESAGAGADGADRASTAGVPRAGAPSPADRTGWSAPPVDRTVATAPPDLAGIAGGSPEPAPDRGATRDLAAAADVPTGDDDTAEASHRGAESDARESVPAGPGRTRPSSTPAADWTPDAPSMTVLRDVAGSGGAADEPGGAVGSSMGRGVGAGPPATGESVPGIGGPTDAADDGSAASSNRAAGTGASPDGADHAGGPDDAVARTVERTIVETISEPRVVDRLYRAIERRRRIERERGGLR